MRKSDAVDVSTNGDQNTLRKPCSGFPGTAHRRGAPGGAGWGGEADRTAVAARGGGHPPAAASPARVRPAGASDACSQPCLGAGGAPSRRVNDALLRGEQEFPPVALPSPGLGGVRCEAAAPRPGPARSRCRPWRSRPWRRAAAGPCGSTGAARRRLSPVPPRSGRRGLLLLLSPPPGPGNGLPARPEERPPVGVERGAGLCCPRAASPRPFPPCPWWVVCCFSLTPITPLANAFHPPHGSGFQLLNLPQLWPAPSWPWCSPLPPPRPCGVGCLGKGDGPCGRKHRLSQV